MNRQLKYDRFFNGIVLTYVILIIILCFIGPLNLGHGLGDLLILIPVIVLTIIHLILTFIFIRQKRSEKVFLTTAVLFLILAIYLTWKVTLGRGIENKWDGHIFTGHWYL
jgi:ABC-type transport system involved in multi-copper enzyme maturation permease subunit